MAVVAVANRNLKDYPAPVVGFHFTVIGFIMTSIYITVEALINWELRLTQYSAKLWAMAYGAALPDGATVLLTILAYQKDKSGFVALISYMVIVYSYIADLVIFREEFKEIELIATIVILFTALGVAFYKLRQQKKV